MNRREFIVAAAAAPFALRATLAAAATGPVAFVTADTDSAVVAVDPFTGRVLRRIATRPDPRSIERVGSIAVVAHTAVGAVTLLHGPSGQIRHVLHDFDEPRYTAAAPGGRHAFVTDSGRADVAVLDVVRGRVVARLRLGAWPRHVSLDSDARRLWVALGTAARTIAVVDVTRPSEPRLVARIRPPFLAHDVGWVPGTRHVFVTSGDRGELALYDARTGKVLRRLPGAAPPQHVTFARGVAFVTSGNDGLLRVHSLANGSVLRTTAVPVGSYNVQEGSGRVLTPSLDYGTLCVLDTHGRLLRRIRVAPSSHDACFMMSA
jgi:DNA-binding beta-propeller fold protein YncE